MGCVASRVDKEERVVICKERKKQMKQLVGLRKEFADAQLAYLRALKNTGVTLRQFTESESLELENTSYRVALPSSPLLSLPPSPPPPPPFSPNLRQSNENEKEDISLEESSIIDEDGGSTPPSSIIQRSSLNFWDPFEPFSSELSHDPPKKNDMVEMVVEENWVETKTEFDEEDQEDEIVGDIASKSLAQKQQQNPVDLTDDNSSTMSWYTKEIASMAAWKSRKTLDSVIKELDDYFLKASAGGKDLAILADISKGDISLPQNLKENKRKRSSSAKVFSALSWSWSSKSLQLANDVSEVCSPNEPCKPGAHGITIDKLYAAEQKLYKLVKEEELTKLEHEKKTILLLKLEEENHDWMKTEKLRSGVEELETDLRRIQHFINTTCSSILELIDAELYPQLVSLTSGLKNMWKNMYECHQVQNHISQQLNHLNDKGFVNMATDYHRQATAQLEAEVNSWYISFCSLIRFQREYVGSIGRWIQLTDCLVEDHQENSYSSLTIVRRLCDEWLLIFNKLPDKIVLEAIKSLLSAIQSIMQQQAEEYNLCKKSTKVEKRLHKEILSLNEMEKKLQQTLAAEESQSDLTPKHPLSLKRGKIEVLKKRVDTEKAKYQNSVQVTRAMTLNSLKTSLPNVFQALVKFSRAYAEALEPIDVQGEPMVECDASENSMNEISSKNEISSPSTQPS